MTLLGGVLVCGRILKGGTTVLSQLNQALFRD